VIAPKLRERLGQPVVVEQRTGAAGNVGAQVVFSAPPDGSTLLFTAPATLVVNKLLYPHLAFDSTGFAAVSLIATTPNLLSVHPKVPAQTLQQLIAYAKANPGRLNYASPGVGSGAHLTVELFKSSANVDMVHVPFQGSAPALTAFVGGQVDMMFSGLSFMLPHIRAGAVRPVAVAGNKRHPLLPDVPALNEVLPGFLSLNWFGVLAPSGTPPAITNRLSASIAAILREPDVEKQLLKMDLDAVGSTPEEMALFMKQEGERWGNVIRATGVKAD
jgi:tripartite-type tricarboxylate transporter receptor subunit TctC